MQPGITSQRVSETCHASVDAALLVVTKLIPYPVSALDLTDIQTTPVPKKKKKVHVTPPPKKKKKSRGKAVSWSCEPSQPLRIIPGLCKIKENKRKQKERERKGGHNRKDRTVLGQCDDWPA